MYVLSGNYLRLLSAKHTWNGGLVTLWNDDDWDDQDDPDDQTSDPMEYFQCKPSNPYIVKISVKILLI